MARRRRCYNCKERTQQLSEHDNLWHLEQDMQPNLLGSLKECMDAMEDLYFFMLSDEFIKDFGRPSLIKGVKGKFWLNLQFCCSN